MTVRDVFDPQQHFDKVAPNIKYWSRLRANLWETLHVKTMRTLGGLPGLGALRRAANEPRQQVFHSGSPMLGKWYTSDFGTPEKPESLREIPWDYVEAYQEEIPFFGLREYWYPALQSKDLEHNEAKAVTLLGDNIVLFRDEEGRPCALENRCPHRGPLLTLGQVNVWRPGTITCRYHGMTFDRDGTCVAFLADGPDSPSCGKINARAYPAQEWAGVIFVYMGVKEPEPITENLPNGHSVLGSGGLPMCMVSDAPYSYLNILDNTVDMTHVGCLHRSCLLFGDQKLGGGVDYEDLSSGDGVHAFLREPGGHAGKANIDEIRWYLPNLVYHGEEFLNGIVNGMWFWFVPTDIGNFKAWNISTLNEEKLGKNRAKVVRQMMMSAFQATEKIAGSSCFNAGDAPMQAAQGRIARWDKDQLTRTDRAILKVREMMKDAHKAEIEERRKAGLDGLVHRVSRSNYQLNGAPAAAG